MQENWYVALELEYYPNPEEDETVIEKAIADKTKVWSVQMQRGSPSQKKSAKIYVDNVKKIRTDMIGPNNIRAKLIKEATEVKTKAIDNNLRILKASELDIQVIEKIAIAIAVSEELVIERAEALGITIKKLDDSQYGRFYQKYYQESPEGFSRFETFKASLASLGAGNLYEFLYLGEDIKNPEDLPSEVLLEKANTVYADKYEDLYSGTSGTGQKLCGNSQSAFKDEKSKEEYDKYLEYLQRHAILNQVKETQEFVGTISQEVYASTLDQLTENLKDRTLAKNVLIGFIEKEKILLGFVLEELEDSSQIKVCRCGVTNDVSDGRTVCKACGLDLEITCPKCGVVHDANIKVCKCGFKFENIDKANALCELASAAIERMEFTTAKAHLADAERYWPGSEQVSKLEVRLQELESRVGNAEKEMQEAVNEKRYYAAEKIYTRMQSLSPDYESQTLKSAIDSALATAAKYKRIAEGTNTEEQIIEACVMAYEACTDYPGIKEMIAKYPPKEARNLVVSVNPNTQANLLDWAESLSTGSIYYSVVRKEAAIPMSVKDGVLVGRVSSTRINDLAVVPGVEYYYAVFAERAGVLSKPLVTREAVINLFEITGVEVAADDGALQFTWNSFTDRASIGIERQQNGQVEELAIHNRTSFVDRGLTNDIKYTYRIYLSYTIGTKNYQTPGVLLSGIPTQPPMPIEKLTMKPLENNKFSIKWENPEEQEPQFYYSEEQPRFSYGELVSIDLLEKEMNSLVVQKTGKTAGTFTHAGDQVIYVLAVVEKSGSTVIGTTARVRRGGSVKINNVSVVNGKILIATDLPKDATGFIVLYRKDQFPEDLSDTKSVRKHISLKQYQFDTGLLIDSNESIDYYFSVFAEFRKDGEADYSTGTDFLFSNLPREVITYSVAVSKRLFGANRLTVTFEAENNAFTLPDIDIMSAISMPPMFKQSAKLFHEISSREVNGSEQVELDLDKKLPRETYIKAFLKDESLHDRYQLKSKVKSNLKIS